MNIEDRYFRLLREGIMDIGEEATETGAIFSQDVALLNQNKGTGFVARDNGAIEAYAGKNLGFRFDPDTETLILMATNVVIVADKVIQKNKGSLFLNDQRQALLNLTKGV